MMNNTISSIDEQVSVYVIMNLELIFDRHFVNENKGFKYMRNTSMRI